jgi:hypothetical protein
MTQDQTQTQGASLEDLTMCFSIRFSAPTARRKADMTLIDTGDTDRELLSVSKVVWDSDEFRAVRRHRSYIKAYIKSKALPSPFLKEGIFSVPIPSIEVMQAKVDEMIAEDVGLVETFIRRYEGADGKESLEQEARRRLGSQFLASDYPDVEKLRSQFSIETQFLETKTPTRLSEISPTLYEAERRRAAERWQVVEQNAEHLLLSGMQECVQRMVDQLGTSEDGRKKAFRKSSVEKLASFLSELPFRNVMQNGDISDLCVKASRLLEGVDVESVKKHDDYREGVRRSFEVLAERLDKLVVVPQRKIVFEE